MTIALIGASGRAGSCLPKEPSDRDHQVTAIARDAARIAELPGAALLDQLRAEPARDSVAY